MDDPIRLDLRGLKCPLPVLRTRKALRRVAPGAVLAVACTDPLARLDLPNLARETGDRVESIDEKGAYVEIFIRKASVAA